MEFNNSKEYFSAESEKIELIKQDLELRYGENSHERAYVYGRLNFELLHEGKQLSFNNILDADAAWTLAKNLTFVGGGACVIKHQTPCGASYLKDGDSLDQKIECIQKAIESDIESSYGG
ncbi:MAG: phosphoribosylaminoimidazolecarboxamide formyltransferase, partial [Fervidobacterium sp.]